MDAGGFQGMNRARRLDAKSADVIIVGAGAAGMTAAICARRLRPQWRIVALDGAHRIGKKLLASGGGRCNLTHRSVTERDYHGGSAGFIRRVFRACDVNQTLRFFRELGVETHIEDSGKVFPADNRAHSVLRALDDGMRRAGVIVVTGATVTSLSSSHGEFRVTSRRGAWRAARVLLATGGRAWPRSGSDGSGFALAAALGHSIVTPVPALVPLLLEGHFHRSLSGVALPAALKLSVAGQRTAHAEGSMLFTRQGVSGPVVLDISRHWTRAHGDGLEARLSACLMLPDNFDLLEKWWMDRTAARPRSLLTSLLSERLPAAVARAVVHELGIGAADTRLAHLTWTERRRVVHALIDWPLPVRASAGFEHAETTAGGVELSEARSDSLESRVCPGLYLAGEVLDVDGRLGGFNLQWAWSSGQVAARGLTRRDRSSL